VSHHAEDHLESFLQWLNPDASSSVGGIRPDFEREQRKGTPEVIFGETKETSQIVAMADALLAKTGRAIISRVRSETVGVLRESFPAYDVRERGMSRMVSIYRPDYVHRSTGGQVGVISAGTSDIPVAEEAALMYHARDGCDHCGGRHGWRVAIGSGRAGGGACDRTTDIGRLWDGRQGCCSVAGDVANVRAGSRCCQYRQWRGRGHHGGYDSEPCSGSAGG
jgi:hypothetical protein